MSAELFNFEEVLSRLKKGTNSKSDTDLAGKLGLSYGAISGAKQKKKVPPAWIVSVATTFGVSADWLLSGDGPMRKSPEVKSETVGGPTAADMLGMKRGDLPPRPQPVDQACPGCARLQEELAVERGQNRELVAENRQLNAENRQLWKENGDLRVEVERLKARAAPDDGNSDELRQSA